MGYPSPSEISERTGAQFLNAALMFQQAREQKQAQEKEQNRRTALTRLSDPNTPDIEKSRIIGEYGELSDILKYGKQQGTQDVINKYKNLNAPDRLDHGKAGQPDAALESGLEAPLKDNFVGGPENPEMMEALKDKNLPTRAPSQPNVPRSNFSENMPREDLRAQKQNLILDLAGENPQLANVMQQQSNQELKGQEYRRRAFESERDFNEKKSADFRKTISGLRQSIPRKQNALQLARTALESEDLSMFSKDHLADILNLPGLRTASGAALNLAVKENLFSNLSRVSAKAQNMWLEKVMAGAFAAKGQTLEANLTVQEALEAELALDKAQTEMYEQLAQQDMQKQGFEGGDIEARTFKAMEPIEKDIRDRMSYRTRSIYEEEKGLKELYKMADKKAPTGTPLTRKMFQIFLKKTGSPEKAIEKAKQQGYTILPNDKVQEYIK